MKSKKPSDTWKLLEAGYRFFLDRNQGNKLMPSILRQAGVRVVCFSEKFTDDTTPDPTWIKFCSDQGDMVVVTGDKALETDPINRQAVIDCKMKVILLEENNSRAVEWASAFIVARRRIVEILGECDGPFFVTIRKNSHTLVSKMRKP